VFDEQSADIWQWQTEVDGHGATRIALNGRDVPVELKSGRFRAHLQLRPGINEVEAYDAAGQSSLLVLNCRLSANPTAAITLSQSAVALALSSSTNGPNPSTQAPLVEFSWSQDGMFLGATPEVRILHPWTDGDHTVVLTVVDTQGRTASASTVYTVSDGIAIIPDLATWHPDWVDRAVVYGVVPPLFGSPPFASVTSHLADLAALGVTVLWLAPIFANVPGDYGYEVIDYFAVRPDWGTVEELQKLIAGAHSLGMKVVLDLPVNDTSSQHPYFQQARRYGPASHYYDFYQRRRDGTPVHYFDWTSLPNLAYDDPEVQTMVIEASLYWLDQLKIDGYRVDAAWGVRRRQPAFWPLWRAALKNANPDIFLLAEGSARESWWGTNGFDAAYDWTESIGQWAWHEVFDDPRHVVRRLRAALQRTDGTLVFRFLDNNDTGERFIAAHGVGMTKAATALLLTLPGIPELFTGSEVGAVYQPYQRTVPLDLSDDPYLLRPLHRQLIELRRTTPQLTGSGFRVVDALPSNAILVFERWSDDTDPVMVAVNFSDQDVTFESGAWSGELGPWSYQVSEPSSPQLTFRSRDELSSRHENGSRGSEGAAGMP
jgi:cyclomaltodextrinase